jgi:uncharacterized membrane protein YsdA (DUF1294 family)
VGSIGIACLFLVVVCTLAARGTLPLAVPAVYLVASAAALIAYRADKSAARTGAWRTSERRLHLLALIGGWPGALVAQAVFRHKSRKASFQLAFWGIVALNCAVLVWLWWPAAS